METGAVIRMKIDVLKTLLGRPLPAKRADLLPVPAKETAWQDDVTQYTQKSAAFRAECQEALRRANRDTITKQATACMRGDLLLHLSFLRKQQAYVATLPLLRKDIQSGALISIKNLIDAEMTIVDALDANLYTSAAIMQDTKVKLQTQYRTPYWLATTKIRADRQLTFIGLMLKRIEEIVLENNSTPLIEKTTLQAVTCLTTGTEAYQAVTTATGAAVAANRISEAGKGLSSCKKTVWTVGHLKRRLAESSTESGALQTGAQN